MHRFLLMCAGISLVLAGCGGSGGGGSGGESTATPATVAIQTVTLSGEVPLTNGTATVTVNGVAATVTARAWSVEVPYSDGDYTVDYRVNGNLIAREAIDIR